MNYILVLFITSTGSLYPVDVPAMGYTRCNDVAKEVTFQARTRWPEVEPFTLFCIKEEDWKNKQALKGT